MANKNYDFGEKSKEKVKQQDGSWKELDVWQSSKYKESRKKAIELIEKANYELEENDFWILMNQGNGKMVYTGLIISHNGCLKINDRLEDNLKFKPLSVSFVRDAGEKEKTMAYINQEQGVYEFGEISTKNCKNDYPYAMVLKRLMDRVILKNSKVGFFGIYSEAESDAFKEKPEAKESDSPLDNSAVLEGMGAKRNAFGLKAGTALTDGSAMKETQEEENKKQFARIKDIIENVGSGAELRGIWFDNAKQISSLKKYAAALYDLLVEAKDTMKVQFMEE